MSGGSTIRRGYSLSNDPAMAVRELHAAIDQPDIALAVFFCSTAYDLEELAKELRQCFGDIALIGCTTAGEITPVGFQEGSITGFSIGGGGSRAAMARIDCLADCPISAGFLAAEALMAQFSESGPPITDANSFGLLLVDGMSTREEVLLSTLHWGLRDIPLLGGSAGDDMRLTNTFIYHEGAFHANAAVLTLVQLDAPFAVFNTKHFRGAGEKLVVTKADPARRRVLELNAAPAADEFARILGIPLAEVTPDCLSDRALMVKIGGEYFVRSVQKIDADGSLTFYSAIDCGVVLTVAEAGDLVGDLSAMFDDLNSKVGPPQLVIGFDCVLRRQEMERRQTKHLASRLMAENNVVGFATYGEQYQSVHLNNTFTGVAIGAARRA